VGQIKAILQRGRGEDGAWEFAMPGMEHQVQIGLLRARGQTRGRTGARSIVPTSGGGFALMTEAVSLAGVSETPVVFVVVQRPGPATGLATRTEQGEKTSFMTDMALGLPSSDNPHDKVVFLGVGFETTAPAIAATVKVAREQGISNFSVLCFHKLVPPALDALIGDPELKVQALPKSGHLSGDILPLSTSPQRQPLISGTSCNCMSKMRMAS